MADLRNLKHDQAATRDSLATTVRTAIHAATGATDVTMAFYAETLDAQSTLILDIDMGTAPFGAAAITNQAFTFTSASATGTKATTNTHTVQSFAILDGDSNKVLRGSSGATGDGNTYDVSIAGSAAIKQNEKIKLTSFTYTASL